ncbi:unnamed protein product [Calypogeia fissa]
MHTESPPRPKGPTPERSALQQMRHVRQAGREAELGAMRCDTMRRDSVRALDLSISPLSPSPRSTNIWFADCADIQRLLSFKTSGFNSDEIPGPTHVSPTTQAINGWAWRGTTMWPLPEAQSVSLEGEYRRRRTPTRGADWTPTGLALDKEEEEDVVMAGSKITD